jgi:MFS family permease
MKAWTSFVCGLLGAASALAFFMQAYLVYAATPSDPQKPIGYIFMAFYSLILGGAVFGLASTILSILSGSRSGKSIVLLSCAALACAAIIAGIMVQHWRDLFPRSKPKQAIQPIPKAFEIADASSRRMTCNTDVVFVRA